jgi:hypothetical protein
MENKSLLDLIEDYGQAKADMESLSYLTGHPAKAKQSMLVLDLHSKIIQLINNLSKDIDFVDHCIVRDRGNPREILDQMKDLLRVD